MNHNQQASLAGHYDDDEALFVNGVIRGGNRDAKRVVEDGGRLRESDAVLTLVRRILSPVPLKCDSIHLRSSLAARATSPYFPRLSPSARIRLCRLVRSMPSTRAAPETFQLASSSARRI